MSINKTILIIFILLQTTLKAPRSLRNNSGDQSSTINDQPLKSAPSKTIKVLQKSPPKTKPQGSLDWTVTTTAELNANIQEITKIISQTQPGESLSEEKKTLLKSLENKKIKTQKLINMTKRKGDNSYNQASFCVNRLSMAVSWYKVAEDILNSKLLSLSYEQNMGFKDHKALESKCKETLFYEVYARVSSSYPDTQQSPPKAELEAIVNSVIKEQTANKNTPHIQLHQDIQARQDQPSTKLREAKMKAIEKALADKRNIQQLQHDLSMAQKSITEHKLALEMTQEQNKALGQKAAKASSEKLEKAIQVASLEQKITTLEKTHRAVTTKLSQEIERLSKEVAEREKSITRLNTEKSKILEKQIELDQAMIKFKQEKISSSIEIKAAYAKRDQALEAFNTQKNQLIKKLAKYNEQQMEKEKEILLKQIKIKQLEEELKQNTIALAEKKLSMSTSPNPSPIPQAPSITTTPIQSIAQTQQTTQAQNLIQASGHGLGQTAPSPSLLPTSSPAPAPTQPANFLSTPVMSSPEPKREVPSTVKRTVQTKSQDPSAAPAQATTPPALFYNL